MEPHELHGGLAAKMAKMTDQDNLPRSWRACQVCLLHHQSYITVSSVGGNVGIHTYMYIYIYIYVDILLHKAESLLTTEEIESDNYGRSSESQSVFPDADCENLSADDLFKMIFVPDEDLCER